MKEYIQSIVTVIVLLVTIYFVCWIRREKYTFLNLSIDANIITQLNEIALVSITITLENKGKTRIEARRKEHLDKYPYLRIKYDPFLYADEWDQCKHACTLKIRRVPDDLKVNLFDWYSLPPITNIILSKEGEQSEGDLEQINYSDEYEKPPEFKEVVFWIEPYETYREQVMVYVPQGIYVIKAFFLGSYIGPPEEDEYWSCTKLIKIM